MPHQIIRRENAGYRFDLGDAMEPLMIALAFAAGFAVQMVRLPPQIGFLTAGFAPNAMGFERSLALDTIANATRFAAQKPL